MAKSKETTIMDIIERVAKLEERVDSGFGYIKEELKDIKENHIHTLQCDVNDLKLKVNTLAVKMGVIVAVVTIVIDIAIRLIFK